MCGYQEHNEKAQHCLPRLCPLTHQEHNSDSPVCLSHIFPARAQVPASRMSHAGIWPLYSVNLKASPSQRHTGNISQRKHRQLGTHTSEVTLNQLNAKYHSCLLQWPGQSQPLGLEDSGASLSLWLLIHAYTTACLTPMDH